MRARARECARSLFTLIREYPNGYVAVGYLLFLQEQIKGIIIKLDALMECVFKNQPHV